MQDKSVIYYTDNRVLENSIIEICREQLAKSFDGEIVSVSLQPIDFGKNIVLEDRRRSYPTMITQILTGLEAATSKYVFFCEHDVLYNPSHFEITPERDDVYYYNVNNWRWRWGTDVAITYNYLASLSMLACNRELAINHYRLRIQKMLEQKLDENRSREPRFARVWGYEPGTKKRRKGGFSDEECVHWRSKIPNIDIRHSKTFSKPKTFLSEFKHIPPDNSFIEKNVFELEGWDNLPKLFKDYESVKKKYAGVQLEKPV